MSLDDMIRTKSMGIIKSSNTKSLIHKAMSIYATGKTKRSLIHTAERYRALALTQSGANEFDYDKTNLLDFKSEKASGKKSNRLLHKCLNKVGKPEYLGKYQSYQPSGFSGNVTSTIVFDLQPLPLTIKKISEHHNSIVENDDGIFTVDTKSKTEIKDKKFQLLVNSVLKTE